MVGAATAVPIMSAYPKVGSCLVLLARHGRLLVRLTLVPPMEGTGRSYANRLKCKETSNRTGRPFGQVNGSLPTASLAQAQTCGSGGYIYTNGCDDDHVWLLLFVGFVGFARCPMRK